MQLSRSVDRFIQLAYSPSAPLPGVLPPAAQAIIRNAQLATAEEVDAALQRLREPVERAELLPAAVASLVCGTLVEQGATPECAGEAILRRTQKTLALATSFIQACMREAAGELPAEVCVTRYREAVSKQLPQEAQAFARQDMFLSAATAILLRSGALRALFQRDDAFLALLKRYPLDEKLYYLERLMSMLDGEEMLVIHPELKRGYRIRIDGIADNFQLHTLLADTLIGDPDEGWLPGTRPDPLAAEACRDGYFPQEDDPEAAHFPLVEGAFNLWNWTALRPDGTLPERPFDASSHWIWNEGTPADIQLFEGIRVILLGPPPYQRTWNAGRFFPLMKGELTVCEVLSSARVEHWLTRMARAPR